MVQTQTKHRLIGAAVLLAVIAIFLPLIFHNAHPSTELNMSSRIPTPPQAPQVILQLPTKPIMSTASLASTTASSIPAPVASKPIISKQMGIATQANHFALPETDKTIQRLNPISSNNSRQVNPIAAIPPQNAKKSNKIKEEVKSVQENTAKKNHVNQTEEAKAGAADPIASNKSRPVNPILLNKTRQVILQSLQNPSAWVVQLAAFADQGNAQHLIKRLRKKGYQAYSRTVLNSKNQSLTRVFVGPQVQRKKILQLQQRLQQQFHLKGVIRRYKL